MLIKGGSMEQSKSWHKLDNSGKIYPFNLKSNIQNLFRISAIMREEVKPEILTTALQNAVVRYPFFNVCLRRGIFWHYLEELNGKPEVYPDSDLIIKDIDTIQTYGFNFRVSYYKNKISIDCFHALCDGNGCMEFFKTILYEYLRLCGHDMDVKEMINLPHSPVLAGEVEDGFLKYAQKVKIKDLQGIDELRGKKAFTLYSDYRFDYKGSGVIEGVVDTDKLLSLARGMGATVTAYIGGALIYSIYKAKITKPDGNLPIVLFVPINLRKPFPSKTLLNFSLFSRVGVDINGGPTFEEIVKKVGDSIKKDTDKNSLQNKVNVTAKTEKLWIFRIMPLPIKQFIYKVSGLFFGNSKKTMTFSNMGVIKLPDEMKEYIDEISIMASTAKTSPAAMTTVTALGKTTLTFARKIVDTEIEKYFFRLLAEQGLDVTVRSNYWEA